MTSKVDIFDKLSPTKIDIFDQISPEKQPVSKARSVISAPVKGAIKGAEELGRLHDPIGTILNQLISQKNPIVNDLAEKFLPTRNETLENVLERGGKLAPSVALGGSGILRTLLQSGVGALAGELAKQEGIGEGGQATAEILGSGLPALAEAVGKKALSVATSAVERLPSGLTKPRAVGAKFAEKGIISPERQRKIISKLDQEASNLAKTTLHKELPLAQQIERGVDFESQFEKRFGDLQKMAEKANPEIDVTPVSEFFSEAGKKYRGIPKLHAEGARVVSEIKAFGNRPQTEMKKLLRIYRSNNKKIKNIYETSRLTGKQQEYVDFLVDYNKNIAKSFENTLPKDSAWIKEFKSTNQDYKQWKDSLKTLNLLQPVLEQRATPATISKLADNTQMQKKLALAMGEKGANEIVQIAKEVRLASEAIKKIPAKDLSVWDRILPLSIFIPYVHGAGTAIGAKKALDWAKRGYGWFLSTDARRSAYNDALKAIISNNQQAYSKAATELQKLLSEEESSSQ